MVKKDKVIDCKFSSYQMDILELTMENAIKLNLFTGKDKIIAQSLLIDIQEQK